jgi:hypothetical protein
MTCSKLFEQTRAAMIPAMLQKYRLRSQIEEEGPAGDKVVTNLPPQMTAVPDNFCSLCTARVFVSGMDLAFRSFQMCTNTTATNAEITRVSATDAACMMMIEYAKAVSESKELGYENQQTAVLSSYI